MTTTELHVKHMATQKVLTETEILSELKLSDLLGDSAVNWRLECRILPRYMPPFPCSTTRPALVVYHPPTDSFLRYSRGPRQGWGWDIYGDDLHNVGLALRAIMEAERPYGKPYATFTLPLTEREKGKDSSDEQHA